MSIDIRFKSGKELASETRPHFYIGMPGSPVFKIILFKSREEYDQFRIDRNEYRDKYEKSGDRSALHKIKEMDMSLEYYERVTSNPDKVYKVFEFKTP